MSAPERRITLGRISGVYGVKGWVRIYSHTAPKENILEYTPWQVCRKGQWKTMKPVSGRAQGKGLVARLEGIDNREDARDLIGATIAIERNQLARPDEDEYYWADLTGCDVVNLDGIELGKVVHLIETGANDVLVVRGEDNRERLIPFTQGQAVRRVDIEAKRIDVDWDPDF